MAGTVWSFHFFFFLKPMGDDQEDPEKVQNGWKYGPMLLP
jgi:hypothetical protein|tara:strand:+ start:2381 stop:2500 length:120 start_codon:yes stop_codon:yes gene_type:complete